MAPPPPDPKFDLRGVSAEVSSLHFSCNVPKPRPPLLFSGSSSGKIHVWNLNTRRAEAILNGHGGKSVSWIQMLPDSDKLMSQGRDLRICLWDLADGRNEVMGSIHLDGDSFCKCSLLNTERSLLAVPGAECSQVQVVEVESKKIISSMTPPTDATWGMAMCMKLWQPKSGSSPLLITGYEDGSIALWDVLEHRVISRYNFHKEPVMSLDFDSDNARGVSGSAENILHVWSLDEQQDFTSYKAQELVNPGIADVIIRQDKKILATAGWDYRVRIFGWKKVQPLAVLQYHSATVHCVSFSDHIIPEERLLAAGSKDQRISLWSIYAQT
ncbi:guanine nucleotide-binding protein subunit beta-like protein 1 [Dendropsophus ebraccatus]|uniref:guanine nucleotide-binding protein subunit beta-like protein 1 n=1 Tax=Dendropsophus ebraccatus TaxID=150705 RepID=UPI0038311071